jgi:hypothetical protein
LVAAARGAMPKTLIKGLVVVARAVIVVASAVKLRAVVHLRKPRLHSFQTPTTQLRLARVPRPPPEVRPMAVAPFLQPLPVWGVREARGTALPLEGVLLGCSVVAVEAAARPAWGQELVQRGKATMAVLNLRRVAVEEERAVMEVTPRGQMAAQVVLG